MCKIYCLCSFQKFSKKYLFIVFSLITIFIFMISRRIGCRMSVMKSCEKIVNRNHVTFFLHLIGLRFFDVEYDWSKNVEINRFKFPTARFVLVQNSIFWKWSDLPFEKKQRVVDFYVLILTTKWRQRKLKKNKLCWESRYVFLFSSLKSYSR